MVRSSVLSKLASGALAVVAFYALVDTSDAADFIKGVSQSVGLALVLEVSLVVSFLARFVVLTRLRHISLWILAGSWFLCAAVGTLYLNIVYGSPPPIYYSSRIDDPANWISGFIILGAIRYLVTATLAFAVSLDEVDSYS